MKTIPVGLAADYAAGAAMWAYALRIERTDATVYRMTSFDRDMTITAQVYSAAQGLDVSGIATSAGFNVDNLELTTADDGSVFTHADILSGRWKGSTFQIMRLNPLAPANGVEVLMTGQFGEITIGQATIKAELLGLQVWLQQPIGNNSTKTCRANFADFPAANQNNRCRLTAATYTFTATVTAVTSNQIFTAAALVQAADYFGAGVLTWTSGLNSGLVVQVQAHAAGGVITLPLAMFNTVQIGDTLSIVAGCRKRMNEDCSGKFSNQLNFQGEPHRPTTDDLTAAAEPDA
ncbi:MAG TPA: DUF2163 domain-containing protein [Burkholderiaceae bacterium]|nr:DUF2163 domain-containing protein [Burkholderiaceae bacterium]